MAYEDQLAKIWIFSKLERSDIARMAKAVVPRSYAKGETVVNEGEQAVAFYVITSGKVQLTKKGAELGTMGPGECFGEMALLDGHPRSASVLALEDTECLAMTRWDFTAELRANPVSRAARVGRVRKELRWMAW